MPSSLLSFLCPEDLLCQHINNDWSLPSAMLTCSSPSLFLNFYYWAFPILLVLSRPFVSTFIFVHSPWHWIKRPNHYVPKEHTWVKNILKSDDQLPSLRTTTAQKPSVRQFSKPNMNPLPILGEHIIQAQEFSESNWSKTKKNCGRATHPRLRFQGSGLKVLGSCSHAISSASYLPTHTTQAI